MTRKLIFLIFVINTLGCQSQIFIGLEKNLDFYKPYTDFGSDYLLYNEKVESSTYSARVYYLLEFKKSHSIGFGLTYMNKTMLIEDKLKGISIVKYNAVEDPIDTLFYYSNFDLNISSHSFGFYFDYNKMLFKKDRTNGSVGSNSSFFIYENAKGRYIDKENLAETIEPEYVQFVPGQTNSFLNTKKGFFMSTINISAYYRQVFQLHENFSLAARVSLGTNVYSDWDQFKKYAWLGLGLEMGFGKVKGKKSE
jgi:hypothetical protein